MTIERTASAIFAKNGVLARCLPRYESRPGQQEMAVAVEQALAEGDLLAVEAETGIGKTLAYLVPAALSRKKVVVSTGTINLQEQILGREIPFIKQHIDPELSAMCVKGRQNYLCLQRWRQYLAAASQTLLPKGEEVEKIEHWFTATSTGDRVELPWLRDDSSLWLELCSSGEKCLGGDCPEASLCFVNQLRRKAAAARILIVNHHLFFSDLAVRRSGHAEVLPRYEAVIFDEAHHLENIATQYFGKSVSLFQFLDLARDVEATAKTELKEANQRETLQLARALATHADRMALLFPKQKGRFPLGPFVDREPGWPGELAALKERLQGLSGKLETLAAVAELWANLWRRTQELGGNLFMITDRDDQAYVYWYERRERAVQLGASPIDLAADLDAFLYAKVGSAVFTSATLSVQGSFSYLQERLGLPRDLTTLALASPFDYRRRTLLYVPANDFPEPQDPRFIPEVSDRIRQLVRASKGRALLLFTSVQAMHAVYGELDGTLDFPLLLQGSATRLALLRRFKEETLSILLAVASFWEGVDVPGEALSCVIIDKLPFEAPNDPVVQARIERIREEGGNPFFDFQVPRAIFALRQGIGRLMRANTDRGVLAIMDVRLFTKRYGRLFLESLPPSPLTRDLGDIKSFFERGSQETNRTE